jgi:hypothetical protein
MNEAKTRPRCFERKVSRLLQPKGPVSEFREMSPDELDELVRVRVAAGFTCICVFIQVFCREHPE